MAALCVGLAGPALAAVPDTAAAFHEDAVQRLGRKDVAGAILQLKNALREQPSMLAAQVLLGHALLSNFEPDAAEICFGRALALGIDRSEVAVPWAQALLMQGKARDLLEWFSPETVSGTRRAQLLALRAEAYRDLGDHRAAARSLEEAALLDPANPLVMLAQADHLAQRRQWSDALATARRALTVNESDARSWYVLGRIQHLAGSAGEALQSYDRALVLAPRYIDARIGRVALLMAQGRSEQVAPDWAFMAREHPLEPRANYLKAVHAQRRGDHLAARAALADAARVLRGVRIEAMKGHGPAYLALAGSVHFGLGEHEKARQYLEAFLSAVPGDVAGRKMLAAVHAARNDPASVIAVLEPAQRVAPADPILMTQMGEALLATRRGQQAMELFQKAAALMGPTATIQTATALSHLQLGQNGPAAELLDGILKRDPGHRGAAIVTALHRLQTGDAPGALTILDVAGQRHPGDPEILNLLGAARAAAGQVAGARDAYLSALHTAPRHVAARLNAGRLEAGAGNAIAARSHFRAALEARPGSAPVLLELARLEAATGQWKDARVWFEKLHLLHPSYLPGGIGLVDVHLASGEPRRALDVALTLEATAPDNAAVLEAQVRVHLALGNTQPARAILGRMDRLARSGEARVQIARLQLRAGNPGGAAYTLEKALAEEPALLAARALLVEAEMARGALPIAEMQARELIALSPTSGAGPRLLGDVQLQQGKVSDAVASFEEALRREGSTENAMRLATAFSQSGQMPRAHEFLKIWLDAHPGDRRAARALAELHLRAGQWSAARARFESLAATGQDPSDLNGLARVHLLQGDIPSAVRLAEKALSLAPDDPRLLDTLGWALARSGLPEAALARLREARLRSPASAEIRYHLAAVLHTLRRTREAVEELGPAQVNSADFPEVRDARQLARQMGVL